MDVEDEGEVVKNVVQVFGLAAEWMMVQFMEIGNRKKCRRRSRFSFH